MATPEQRDALRFDLDLTEALLDNTTADTLIARAEARYGAGNSISEAYSRIIVIRRLKAAAAKRVDYRQNQSEEKLGQLVKNLDELLKVWLDVLDEELNRTTAAVRFGGLKRYNPRYQEFPSDWEIPSIENNDVSRTSLP